MSKHESGAASVGGGVSLATVLFLIFLVLKFVGVIDWSWWWVTSPLWISVLLFIAALLIIFIVFLIIALVEYCSTKRREKRRGY